MHTCTPPHKGSWSGVTHAGVKTQWRGGRMTSQYPAEQQVPWSWIMFKHTHKGSYTHTRLYMYMRTLSSSTSQLQPPPSHVHTNTLNISSPEIMLAVLRRHWSYVFDFQLHMGSGGDEPMVGQDMGTLWQDLAAEVEQHGYLKGERAIHLRRCKTTITSCMSLYTYCTWPAFSMWSPPAAWAQLQLLWWQHKQSLTRLKERRQN